MTRLTLSQRMPFTANLFQFSSSQSFRFVIVAVTASSITAASIFAYQRVSRYQRTRELKKSLVKDQLKEVPLSSFGGSSPSEPVQLDWDESLIKEQLARNIAFLGEGGVAKIRQSFIIVVGAGGVGSWAAAMLIRSGVGKLRLIDFDQVTLSSLNRHAVATLEDVGTPKVIALRKHLSQVAPWVDIDARIELWTKEVANKLLSGNPTMVIDAIDNIPTKCDLLHYCRVNNIQVISSMGSGCKADPTLVQIGDISKTTEDPLSRAVRRKLRLLGVSSGIPVVYSTEKPGKASLVPLEQEEYEKGQVHELSVLLDFRVRILPVIGPLPGIFGLTLANYAITKIADYPVNFSLGKSRSKIYDAALKYLTCQEQRLFSRHLFPLPSLIKSPLPLTLSDVNFVIEEIYGGKSAVPPHHKQKLVLTRWRKENTISITNVVCMTKEEAERHEMNILKQGKTVEEIYAIDVLSIIENRIQEAKEIEKLR